MSDTIFFKAKLKRTKTPLEVYEKIEKKINTKANRKGPTKEWEIIYDPDDESIVIDFHDDKSETFYMELDKKEVYDGFCKVYFPMDNTLFEDGSQFKTLLDIFYSIKNCFNTIEFSDDYGLADGYWNSKKFKFEYRELTEDEYKRVEKWYRAGYTKHEELLRAIMAEDMEMTYDEFIDYENPDIASPYDRGKIINTLRTYVYETSEFRKEGRVSDKLEEFTGDPEVHTLSFWSFSYGIADIFCDGTGYRKEIIIEKPRSNTPQSAQIALVYSEKFAPLFVNEKDQFQRCVLAYRFFLSVYEFTGFKFVGRKRDIKLVIDEVIKEFGKEKGERYLTCYITSERYIFKHSNGKEYGKLFVKNATERYGEDFLEYYVTEFKRKYEKNARFRHETKYYADTKLKYVDDSLVL